MSLETLTTKSLGMKAPTVVQVEEVADGGMLARVERLPGRRLACGECGRPARRWQDLALRGQPLRLVYAPYRVWCLTCGPRVERVPWAEKWQRVTDSLARAVAVLARKLGRSSLAAHFRLNWKTVASVVEAAVLWRLAHRRWTPLHVVGIDEVSRRKGQQYLALVYDLARRRVVWAGKDHDERTVQRFFT
jgi:transposase